MTLRFYEIAEANHRIMNPLSEAQLMQLGERCQLKPGMRQLDLACGQGEMLCRWAQKHGITGTGVDISEFFVSSARQRAEELDVAAQVTFEQADAAKHPVEQHAYDIVSCIGATWIGGGTVGTLNLMKPALKDSPDAMLLVGEVYWRQEPTAAACEALGFERDYLTDLGGLLDRFAEVGVELVEMLITSRSDFDHYEGKRWWTVHQWLRANPDDPDAAALKQWNAECQRAYLDYERPYVGWGVFVLKPVR